jgi:hypothetical protein
MSVYKRTERRRRNISLVIFRSIRWAILEKLVPRYGIGISFLRRRQHIFALWRTPNHVIQNLMISSYPFCLIVSYKTMFVLPIESSRDRFILRWRRRRNFGDFYLSHIGKMKNSIFTFLLEWLELADSAKKNVKAPTNSVQIGGLTMSFSFINCTGCLKIFSFFKFD